MKAVPNPPPATRMRGVVEKCTFCDERIARGEQPACVAACPNDEIVFGDLNDSSSRVRRMHESPRAYAMIEEFNARTGMVDGA